MRWSTCRYELDYLMCDVGASVGNVSASLGKDALVIVAVQEGVLDVALSAAFSFSTTGDPVRFQARLLQNDEKPSLGGCDASPGYVCLYGQHGRIRRARQRVVRRHFACL